MIDERSGIWGAALEVPGSTPDGFRSGAGANTIWCASSGNCQAGGFVKSGSADNAYVVTESAGHWGNLHVVAASLNTYGNAATDEISCASYGNCVAIGFYQYNVGPNG